MRRQKPKARREREKRRYISEAERERENWFTLLEAFTLVCADYSFEDALKLTRDLLVQEIPRAWEPPPEPDRDRVYNLPPQGGKVWHGAEIALHSDCLVRDTFDWDAYHAADDAVRDSMPYPREPRQRVLLLHKATFLAAYEAKKLAEEKSGQPEVPRKVKRRRGKVERGHLLAFPPDGEPPPGLPEGEVVEAINAKLLATRERITARGLRAYRARQLANKPGK